MRIIALLLLLCAAPVRQGVAQWYSCAHQSACLGGYDEWVGGAAANLVLRGPWIAKSWRRPLPRLVLFTVASAFYERVIDYSGWENRDFWPRLGGYLLTEGVCYLWRHR